MPSQGAYGFHGDEMYYVVAGLHPASATSTATPTPLLSAASVALLGVSPTAVRVLPALEMGLVVVLVGLIARDLGGSRRAQLLAAITAALSGYLGAGHLDTTTEPRPARLGDHPVARGASCSRARDARLWLAVGITAGIGLENKDTLLFLGAGLAVGLVLARRWDVMRSPWAWAALGIALLLWAPNLAWQAANGWPQVTMASRIAGYAAENRAQILPLLWLFTGPILSL